jgi:hypothetical protein
LGFLLVIAGSVVSPPRLYQETDIQIRLEIVEDHMARWTASNVLLGMAGLVTAVGLILFSYYVRADVNSLLNWTALLAYSLGALAWIIFLSQRQVDPAQLFEDYTFSPLAIGLISLMLLGLLLYGVIFIQSGYPGWLGYGTVGLTAIIGILAIIFQDRFFANFPPQVFYLITLVAGIVMLRR